MRWATVNRIHDLMRKSMLASMRRRNSEKATIYKSKVRSQQSPACRHLDLGLPDSRTARNKCLLFVAGPVPAILTAQIGFPGAQGWRIPSQVQETRVRSPGPGGSTCQGATKATYATTAELELSSPEPLKPSWPAAAREAAAAETHALQLERAPPTTTSKKAPHGNKGPTNTLINFNKTDPIHWETPFISLANQILSYSSLMY